MTYLDAARHLWNAGCCVVPVRDDGSKAPAVKWAQYTASGGLHPRPSLETLTAWFAPASTYGVGVVTGAASSHQEMVEFEARAVGAGKLTETRRLAHDNGLADLWEKVTTGYAAASPSGGIHFHIRVPTGVRANTVLARTADGKVLIETRGEGGFTVAPPSNGTVHPNGGAWTCIAGSPHTIPTLTADEYDELHLLLGLHDETPPAAPPQPPPGASETPREGEPRPGDDFNTRHTWDELLTERGWAKVRTIGGETCWRRPGKPSGSGISATTGRGEYDNLYNFSTNADLPVGQPISKLMAYAHWHHNGNLTDAVRDLGKRGYGTPPLRLVHSTDPSPGATAAAAAGHPSAAGNQQRGLHLTLASGISPRPVKWLWDGRIPIGALSLLGGREGIGKSTVAYSLAADLTRGRLSGKYTATPRAVVVAATEDSWEHTIVPRLLAHGADLDLVYRVEAVQPDGELTGLSLPADLDELGRRVEQVGASLILLDPLMSRLHASLDTHKDGEVRQALEPLVRVAERTGAAILGLIHVNKGTNSDPLTALMGSRAFAAVARAVLFVMVDPDDENQRLLGQVKNNLGRINLGTFVFGIEEALVAETEEGPVTTGRIGWRGTVDRSIHEALESARESSDVRSQTKEAGEFLVQYLRSVGGVKESSDVKKEAMKAGFSNSTIDRARGNTRIQVESVGFPRRTYWRLPPPAPVSSGATGVTDATEHDWCDWGDSEASTTPPPTTERCDWGDWGNKTPLVGLVQQDIPPSDVSGVSDNTPRASDATEEATLDWRQHRTGIVAACIICGQLTVLRDDDNRPCHKTCAEDQAR